MPHTAVGPTNHTHHILLPPPPLPSIDLPPPVNPPASRQTFLADPSLPCYLLIYYLPPNALTLTGCTPPLLFYLPPLTPPAPLPCYLLIYHLPFHALTLTGCTREAGETRPCTPPPLAASGPDCLRPLPPVVGSLKSVTPMTRGSAEAVAVDGLCPTLSAAGGAVEEEVEERSRLLLRLISCSWKS